MNGSGDGYEMTLGILERAVYRNKEYSDIQGKGRKQNKQMKQDYNNKDVRMDRSGEDADASARRTWTSDGHRSWGLGDWDWGLEFCM